MRKILLSLILILLLVFAFFTMKNGTNLGDVWGFGQIDEKNKSIDEQNAKLGDLISVDYPQAMKKLDASSEKMQQAKKEYEEQAVLVSDSRYYNQTEKYKMEFLWTKIGNYAKDNDVNLKLDITNGTANELYNLNFTVIGKYSDVAGFIYDIENDSKLGFKVEKFAMVGASNTTSSDGNTIINGVKGEFTCTDIRIDVKSLDDYSTNQVTSNTRNTTSNDNNNRNSNPATTPVTTPTATGTPTTTPTTATTQATSPNAQSGAAVENNRTEATTTPVVSTPVASDGAN